MYIYIKNFLRHNNFLLQKFIGPFLKDVGHSVYSYAQSLLDEENFIDQAGLVIMRHMVGEVSFFTLLSFSEMETKLNVRRGCKARMLG